MISYQIGLIKARSFAVNQPKIGAFHLNTTRNNQLVAITMDENGHHDQHQCQPIPLSPLCLLRLWRMYKPTTPWHVETIRFAARRGRQSSSCLCGWRTLSVEENVQEESTKRQWCIVNVCANYSIAFSLYLYISQRHPRHTGEVTSIKLAPFGTG